MPPEHVLLPDAHQFRAGGFFIELDGFQLDFGVLVLFRAEEESPFAFVEVRAEAGEGIHPGVHVVGICTGRGDVSNEVVATGPFSPPPETTLASSTADAMASEKGCPARSRRFEPHS